ncbi:MAG: pilus assembly protein TadE [Bifidobacterium breve]
MPRMSRLEEGSGTMAGVMLVMLVGVALSATACIGNLVFAKTGTFLADLIAFDAAMPHGKGGRTIHARSQVSWPYPIGVALPDCMVQSDDVQVTVAVDTAVPLTPRVANGSAGPAE